MLQTGYQSDTLGINPWEDQTGPDSQSTKKTDCTLIKTWVKRSYSSIYRIERKWEHVELSNSKFWHGALICKGSNMELLGSVKCTFEAWGHNSMVM